MATVSEVSDLDSGVASPEATPDGQAPPIKKTADAMLSSEKNSIDLFGTIKEDKPTESNSIIENKEKSLSVLSENAGNDSDEDDDSIDESLVERLWGLTEMFPTSVRSASSTLTKNTVSLIKGTYQLSRQVVWVAVSTSVLLLGPVMFEIERFNVEEMVKQDRNRLVLGPGSAMSGPPPPPGLTPTPR